MSNLTVDYVLCQLDGSEFEFPGSDDVNSADENYEPIANGRDVEERDDQGCSGDRNDDNPQQIVRTMKKKADISAQNTLIYSNKLRRIPPHTDHYDIPAFANVIYYLRLYYTIS